jgi:hypothetical protein
MILSHKTNLTLALLLILTISACSSANESPSIYLINKTASIELDVYKSPTCGCCGKWIDHMKDQGILAKPHNTNSLAQLKDEKNLPKNFRSCHTAISKDGYIFEGHIPAKIVKQFLKNKPQDLVGLVVPGMPVGSPGMAYQNKFIPYNVLSIHKDGSVSKYARVYTEKEQF